MNKHLPLRRSGNSSGLLNEMKNVAPHILLATDFSVCSTKAMEYACIWATNFQADLTIVHVVGNYAGMDLDEAIVKTYIEEQIQQSHEKLEHMVIEAKQYIPGVQSRLVSGNPTEEICQVALESQADLMIMGTHGWTGYNRAVMESVTERVVCQAPCPVLTIRTQEEVNAEWVQPSVAQTPSVPKHILIPLDFSHCSLDAFEYATQIAKWFDASVTILHALEPLSYSLDLNLMQPVDDKQLRQSIEIRLSELADNLKKDGLSADYLLGAKPSVDNILGTSTDAKADLVVMGTHGRRGLSRVLMGSVTASILRRSSCPVLTVKSPQYKHQDVKGEFASTSSPSG